MKSESNTHDDHEQATIEIRELYDNVYTAPHFVHSWITSLEELTEADER